jgi:DNA-damage-inducible protein J
MGDKEIEMTATINTRIDSEVKEEATKILGSLGLTPSCAVYIFFKQIILHRGLPFEVRLPNRETIQAIEELEAGKGARFATTKELFEDLNR